MRLLLAALLCTVSALAQDVVVFRGTPSTRLFASVDSENSGQARSRRGQEERMRDRVQKKQVLLGFPK